eukprot:767263-Hanusia_phi.AAC.14
MRGSIASSLERVEKSQTARQRIACHQRFLHHDGAPGQATAEATFLSKLYPSLWHICLFASSPVMWRLSSCLCSNAR